MATTISVNKLSVAELLRTGISKPFVIPEYQRPYAWTAEQIETLFSDIWEFANTIGGTKRNGSYFLGSIVSFENDKGEQEIIDGQQRITSLFLLLRAIYTKLIQGDDANTDAAQNFIRQIEPAIWRTDNLTGKVDYSNTLLTSEVVDNTGNEILKNILEKGIADPSGKDNYSKNYILFQKMYEEHCAQAPLQIYDFIYALLNQSILLPIGADSQDTALTIFSTLNNRGLPLSDADIFKAKIYNNLNAEEKESFITKWKVLEKEAADSNESIQQLFYYYMFVLRARENDINTTTPGVRKYFSENRFARLFNPYLMDELQVILGMWKVINTNHDILEESWDNNLKIRKALDVLTSYPNEFWKYPVIIYYLSHRKKENFDDQFLLFLNKLSGELMMRFAVVPTINAVKPDVLKLNAKIVNNTHPEFSSRALDLAQLEEKIKIPHRNIIRMLLKAYAYNHQDILLPDNWQIEHILPQKWQSTFFTKVEDDVINEKIEHIGNKTPFERKLNIVASNGYFLKKQVEYQKSKIEVTKALVASISSDWTLEHIDHRDKIVVSELMNLKKTWDEAYSKSSENNTVPTEQQQAMIEEFKKKGWV